MSKIATGILPFFDGDEHESVYGCTSNGKPYS